jgi:hypothetical protein
VNDLAAQVEGSDDDVLTDGVPTPFRKGEDNSPGISYPKDQCIVLVLTRVPRSEPFLSPATKYVTASQSDSSSASGLSSIRGCLCDLWSRVDGGSCQEALLWLRERHGILRKTPSAILSPRVLFQGMGAER